MSKQSEKSLAPAYGSFKTLSSFSDEVREGGHIPLQVDRTLMPKLSGSAASETIATLRFLGLVVGEKAVPTSLFAKFVMATAEDRKPVLAQMVRDSYAFLFKAPGFDIERASGQQVADLFRAEGISGSTLTRAVSFFLAAAKDAGIKVSHNVKPPQSARSGGKPKKDKKGEMPPPDHPNDESLEGIHRFELPIPGKPSVQVLVPASLDAADWEMLSQMFGIYVNRWKGYSPSSMNKKESPE